MLDQIPPQAAPPKSDDTITYGATMVAIGIAILTLRPRSGHRVLEVRAPDVLLSRALGEIGCDTTVHMAAPHITDPISGLVPAVLTDLAQAQGRFDLIVSRGGLREEGDHVSLLARLKDDLLATGGRLVLIGEALDESLPAPWMRDPSPSSTSLMRESGKTLVVFRPSYLLAVLDALEMHATLVPCALTPVANMIIAGRKHASIPR